MGARVYLPTIGRFTAVDPIEGGVDNNYVYPTDPVNEWDLTGMIGWRKWFNDRKNNALSIRNKVNYQAQKHPRVTDAVVMLISRGSSRSGPGKSSQSFRFNKGNQTSVAARQGFTKRIAPQKLPFNSHGQPAYMNKKGQYITPDKDSHKGGSWKLMDRNGNRIGTYNENLTRRIGD